MIHVRHHTLFNGEIEQVKIVIFKESLEDFKELVHRATNLWPDAPVAIKNFADQITQPELIPAGKEGLQDYTDSNSRTTLTKAKS